MSRSEVSVQESADRHTLTTERLRKVVIAAPLKTGIAKASLEGIPIAEVAVQLRQPHRRAWQLSQLGGRIPAGLQGMVHSRPQALGGVVKIPGVKLVPALRTQGVGAVGAGIGGFVDSHLRQHLGNNVGNHEAVYMRRPKARHSACLDDLPSASF